MSFYWQGISRILARTFPHPTLLKGIPNSASEFSMYQMDAVAVFLILLSSHNLAILLKELLTNPATQC